MVEKNIENDLAGLAWKDWGDALTTFQDWLEIQHNPLIRSWWRYLQNLFVNEASMLLKTEDVCIDVGCGHGGALTSIVKNVYCQGIGLDPMSSSLKNLKKSLRNTRLSDKIDLVQGVAEFLPFREDCTNLSMMSGSLDHVNNTNKTIAEFERIIAHRGYLLIQETVLLSKRAGFFDNTHNRQFTSKSIKSMFPDFETIKITTKFPVFSQIKIPDKFLEYCVLYKILSKAPGLMGMCFNHSEVLFKFRKP
jgi:ubiquinone/menaquinone biosynthesis C-methylase UbiE